MWTSTKFTSLMFRFCCVWTDNKFLLCWFRHFMYTQRADGDFQNISTFVHWKMNKSNTDIFVVSNKAPMGPGIFNEMIINHFFWRKLITLYKGKASIQPSTYPIYAIFFHGHLSIKSTFEEENNSAWYQKDLELFIWNTPWPHHATPLEK